jgi:hypothetical protein
MILSLLKKRRVKTDIEKLEEISIGYDYKSKKYIIPKNCTCNFSNLMVKYGRAKGENK